MRMGLTVGSVLKNILQNEVARDLGFILKKIPGIEAQGALCINLDRDTLAGNIFPLHKNNRLQINNDSIFQKHLKIGGGGFKGVTTPVPPENFNHTPAICYGNRQRPLILRLGLPH